MGKFIILLRLQHFLLSVVTKHDAEEIYAVSHFGRALTPDVQYLVSLCL